VVKERLARLSNLFSRKDAAGGDQSPAEVTAKSVVVLIRTAGDDGTATAQALEPWIQQWNAVAESSDRLIVLQKDSSRLLDLAWKIGKRETAPYEILVRIDLHSEPPATDIQLLRDLRDTLSADRSVSFIMFMTDNFQFIKRRDTKNSDVVMAFILRWHPTLNQQEALGYWRTNHGPLILKLGVPAIAKSYTQIHVDLDADTSLFDHDIEGLACQTMSGTNRFLLALLTNPKLFILNNILKRDELEFTQTPLVSIFKTLSQNPPMPPRGCGPRSPEDWVNSP
jgi:hypothetical protein